MSSSSTTSQFSSDVICDCLPAPPEFHLPPPPLLPFPIDSADNNFINTISAHYSIESCESSNLSSSHFLNISHFDQDLSDSIDLTNNKDFDRGKHSTAIFGLLATAATLAVLFSAVLVAFCFRRSRRGSPSAVLCLHGHKSGSIRRPCKGSRNPAFAAVFDGDNCRLQRSATDVSKIIYHTNEYSTQERISADTSGEGVLWNENERALSSNQLPSQLYDIPNSSSSHTAHCVSCHRIPHLPLPTIPQPTHHQALSLNYPLTFENNPDPVYEEISIYRPSNTLHSRVPLGNAHSPQNWWNGMDTTDHRSLPYGGRRPLGPSLDTSTAAFDSDNGIKMTQHNNQHNSHSLFRH